MKQAGRGMIVAVIPAKSDSRRLPNKNMVMIEGRPLLYYTLKVARECRLIDAVYVSTDSSAIAEFARREGVSVIMRTAELCGETPLTEVYRDALFKIDKGDILYIVGLQPDHPDRSADLEDMIRYALKEGLDDLISVDTRGIKNGSVRIMKAQALKEGRISLCGSFMDDSTNIHSLRDLNLARVRLKQRSSPLSIRLKDKVISRSSQVFVIAEGACNHMCDMNLAKRMIDEAMRAGADAIKFQTYKAERLVVKGATSYWKYASVRSQYEYYKRLDKFDREEYKELFRYADEKGIILFSSPFDINGADMLNELGMPVFKIASCLIPDRRFIRHIARFNKPIILSTGGSDLSEVQEAVDTIYSEGNHLLVIMACTLSYPARNSDAQLLRIRRLAQIFPEAIIGYSDHTEPDEDMIIPSVAVGLGAKAIEKHFTLDRNMTGSGHAFSVDPPLLKRMVRNIRLAEEVMGDEDYHILEVEKRVRRDARMSIVARCRIRRGDLLREDMITFKRPGTGISPGLVDEVIGKRICRDIQSDEQIRWEDLASP